MCVCVRATVRTCLSLSTLSRSTRLYIPSFVRGMGRGRNSIDTGGGIARQPTNPLSLAAVFSPVSGRITNSFRRNCSSPCPELSGLPTVKRQSSRFLAPRRSFLNLRTRRSPSPPPHPPTPPPPSFTGAGQRQMFRATTCLSKLIGDKRTYLSIVRFLFSASEQSILGQRTRKPCDFVSN